MTVYSNIMVDKIPINSLFQTGGLLEYKLTVSKTPTHFKEITDVGHACLCLEPKLTLIKKASSNKCNNVTDSKNVSCIIWCFRNRSCYVNKIYSYSKTKKNSSSQWNIVIILVHAITTKSWYIDKEWNKISWWNKEVSSHSIWRDFQRQCYFNILTMTFLYRKWQHIFFNETTYASPF